MNLSIAVLAAHRLVVMQKKLVLGPAAAGLVSVPASLVGVLPTWVLVVEVVLAFFASLVVLVGRATVTEVLRIRSSLADPVTAHAIDTGYPTVLPVEAKSPLEPDDVT